jgi:hypothetical protein
MILSISILYREYSTRLHDNLDAHNTNVRFVQLNNYI